MSFDAAIRKNEVSRLFPHFKPIDNSVDEGCIGDHRNNFDDSDDVSDVSDGEYLALENDLSSADESDDMLAFRIRRPSYQDACSSEAEPPRLTNLPLLFMDSDTEPPGEFSDIPNSHNNHKNVKTQYLRSESYKAACFLQSPSVSLLSIFFTFFQISALLIAFLYDYSQPISMYTRFLRITLFHNFSF